MSLFVSDEVMFQALAREKQALLQPLPGSTGLQTCDLETQQIQRFALDVFIPQSISSTSDQPTYIDLSETSLTDSMPISLPTSMIAQTASTPDFTPMHHSTSNETHSHQLDMALAPEYVHGVASSCPTETFTAMTERLYPPVTAYSPSAYVSKIGKRHDSVVSPTQQRQHVAAGEVNQHSISTPSFDHGVLMPDIQEVSSCTNMSKEPSYHPLLTSEGMCRNMGWSTSTSTTDSFDMIQIDSSSSNFAGQLFAFDADVDAPLAPRKKYSATRDATFFGWDENGNVFSNTLDDSIGVDLSLPSHHLATLRNVAVVDNEHQYAQSMDQATYLSDSSDMRRSDSGQSTTSMSSSSTTLSFPQSRDSVRRRKHIENSKQNRIAPKTTSVGTTSTFPQSRSSRRSEPLSTAVSARVHKKLISKARYSRRQQPKLLCHRCTDYPLGFRGDHELRRHMDRAHSQYRNVWICTQPSKPSVETWLPAQPLANCKQCRRQKQYNMYYNAAAHLRRAHFCPQKRGRKARGEVRISRPGKTGGDWPPIEWLKANGWLRQIAVDASLAPRQYQVESGIDNRSDEFEAGRIYAVASRECSFTSDALTDLFEAGLQPPGLHEQLYNTASTTSTYEYSTPLDTGGSDQAVAVAYQHRHTSDQQLDAPIMDRTVSAPASFSLYNLGGPGSGYGGPQYY